MAAALLFPCDVDSIDSMEQCSMPSRSRKALLASIFSVDISLAAALLFSYDVDGIGISLMFSRSSKSLLFP